MFLGCNNRSKKDNYQLWIFTNMHIFFTGNRLQSVSTASILIFYTTFSFALSNIIVQGPADINAVEGSSGYLTCYIERDSTEYIIKWLRGQEIISNEDVEIDKFKENFSAKLGHIDDRESYFLSIANVQRKDGHYLYTCAVYKREKQIEKSTPAQINVIEIPSLRYPECTPIMGQMTDGIKSFIICRSERTNPLPTLRLVRNDDETVTYETRNESNYIVIEHSFTPSVTDENDKTTFMCILETPAKKEYKRNCSFGPFNVMHRPEMTIKGEEIVVEDKEVIYICQGKGNPSQIDYQWKFIPQLPEDAYKLESYNSILRLTPTLEMTSTKILCVGSNSIGTSSTFFILNITSREDQGTFLPASARPYTGKDSKNLTMATILSIAGTCLLVISVLASSTICYIYLCFRKNFHPLGYKIAQPDVYSEPRDSLPPPVLSTDRVARWQKRNVGIQVSLDYINEEPLYSETPTAKVTEIETTIEETPQNRSATYV